MQRDAIVHTGGRCENDWEIWRSRVYGPREIRQAGDELGAEFSTVDKVLGKLGRATGRDLQTVYMTDEEIAEGSNLSVAGVLMMRGLAECVESWIWRG